MTRVRRHDLCIVGIALILSSGACFGATLSREEIVDLYSEGKSLFRQAADMARADPKSAKELYVRAARRWERIARKGGIHNGRLYYNIGNTWFRIGDLGRAILNYRRAERYMPNDPNLIQNLQYARSRRRDPFEEPERRRVLKTVLFWHYDLSMPQRSRVFAVCYVLFWVGASTRLFARKAFPKWALVCVGLVAALFLGSVAAETAMVASEPAGVILADEVVARKGDGETYQPSFKEPLHAGTEFRLIEERRDWRHIELPDGRRCWIPAKSSELVRGASTKSMAT